MKTLTVRAESDLLDEFKELCSINDRTQAQEVRDFIRSYVKKNRKKLDEKGDSENDTQENHATDAEPQSPMLSTPTAGKFFDTRRD